MPLFLLRILRLPHTPAPGHVQVPSESRRSVHRFPECSVPLDKAVSVLPEAPSPGLPSPSVPLWEKEKPQHCFLRHSRWFPDWYGLIPASCLPAFCQAQPWLLPYAARNGCRSAFHLPLPPGKYFPLPHQFPVLSFLSSLLFQCFLLQIGKILSRSCTIQNFLFRNFLTDQPDHFCFRLDQVFYTEITKSFLTWKPDFFHHK